MDFAFFFSFSLEHLKNYFSIYILVLSAFLIILSIIDFFLPDTVFALWTKWSNHRYFRFHGLLLILGGLPLTQFRENISGYLMFAIGAGVVLSGPFILLFPEKFSNILDTTSETMTADDRKYLMYADGIVRLISALIFIYAIFLSKLLD